MSAIVEKIKQLVWEGKSVTFAPKFDPETGTFTGDSFVIRIKEPITPNAEGEGFLVGNIVESDPLAIFWLDASASIAEILGKMDTKLENSPKRAVTQPNCNDKANG